MNKNENIFESYATNEIINQSLAETNNSLYDRQNNMVYNDSNNNDNLNYYQGNYNNENKNAKWKYVIVAIIAIVLILAVFFVMNIVKDDNDSQNNKGNNEDSIGLTRNVYYGGFILKVPSDIIYEFEESKDYIVFNDDTDDWCVIIQLINNDMYKLIDYESSGMHVNAYNQKTYNGIDCDTVEITSEKGENALFGYVRVDSSNMFMLMVTTESNTYDYNIFEKFVNILTMSI